MNPTYISEKGLESLITRHLTGVDGLVFDAGAAAKTPSALAASKAEG